MKWYSIKQPPYLEGRQIPDLSEITIVNISDKKLKKEFRLKMFIILLTKHSFINSLNFLETNSFFKN